ncbi:MAG: hypothetical protein JRN15_11985 [Nitrososphaerota archaeon]|nr:hypothetical protein [Nitrososphaerota archaeon]
MFRKATSFKNAAVKNAAVKFEFGEIIVDVTLDNNANRVEKLAPTIV